VSETSRVASEDQAAFEDGSAASHEFTLTGWLSNAHVIAFGAGVGFFALSFLSWRSFLEKNWQMNQAGGSRRYANAYRVRTKGQSHLWTRRGALTVTPSKSGLSQRMCVASARPPRHGNQV